MNKMNHALTKLKAEIQANFELQKALIEDMRQNQNTLMDLLDAQVDNLETSSELLTFKFKNGGE